MTAGLLDDVQSGKQQYWFNTQIGKGLVITDQYLERATGGCGECALHYTPPPFEKGSSSSLQEYIRVHE